MKSKPRLLLIAKNYPPDIGWMQQYSYELHQQLKKKHRVFLVANRRWTKWLPVFGARAVLTCLFLAPFCKEIRSCDGSVSIIGLFFAKVFRKRSTVTIHGLDITWRKKFYQKYWPGIIAKHDKVICVSEYTKSECVKRGIPQDRISVIPNTLNTDDLPPPTMFDHSEFLDSYSIPSGKTILLYVGRWIERKWVHWFLKFVVTKLDPKFHLVIVGYGKYGPVYQELVEEFGLRDKVTIVGTVSPENKAKFYQSADIFVMPNIPVDGDPEGYGIVIIEACHYGVERILASGLEGILTAKQDHPEIQLLSPGDADGWCKAILSKPTRVSS